MRQLIKRLSKQSEEESQAYARYYADEQNRQNVYVDRDVKVSAPRPESDRKISEDDIAEDIEFEELK